MRAATPRPRSLRKDGGDIAVGALLGRRVGASFRWSFPLLELESGGGRSLVFACSTRGSLAPVASSLSTRRPVDAAGPSPRSPSRPREHALDATLHPRN